MCSIHRAIQSGHSPHNVRCRRHSLGSSCNLAHSLYRTAAPETAYQTSETMSESLPASQHGEVNLTSFLPALSQLWTMASNWLKRWLVDRCVQAGVPTELVKLWKPARTEAFMSQPNQKLSRADVFALIWLIFVSLSTGALCVASILKAIQISDWLSVLFGVISIASALAAIFAPRHIRRALAGIISLP